MTTWHPDLRPGTAAPPYAEGLYRAVLQPKGVQRTCPYTEGPTLQKTNRNGPREQVEVLKQEFIPTAYVGVDSRDPPFKAGQNLLQIVSSPRPSLATSLA